MIVGQARASSAGKNSHKFAGHDSPTLAVWNPPHWQPEDRIEITDPLTTQKSAGSRGLQLPLILPRWAQGGVTRGFAEPIDMALRLRSTLTRRGLTGVL